MSLLLTYMGTKEVGGDAKKAADGGGAIVILMAVIFVAPYAWFLYKTRNHAFMKLKEFDDYKINTDRIRLYKGISIAMLILAFPMIWGIIMLAILQDMGLEGFFGLVGTGLLINIGIIFYWVTQEEENLKQIDLFKMYLDDLGNMLDRPKQILTQTLVNVSRDSEGYGNKLNSELENTMKNVQNKYQFSDETLSVIKDQTRVVLDS